MSLTSKPLVGLFDLPAEVRTHIWTYCVSTSCNRNPTPDGLATYTPSLNIFRTCKQIYAEAYAEFHRCNRFIKLASPWTNTRDYVEGNGHIPILLEGAAASRFPFVHLECRLDAPAFSISFAEVSCIIICEDDLPAFGRLWWYTELTHDHINRSMRLRLIMRSPSNDPSASLPRAIQKKLLDPFTNVKRLSSILVEGNVDPGVRETFLEKVKEPYESPESCIQRALACKDDGNKFLADGKYSDAIAKFEDSFRAMFIIVSGRQRDEWGEAHFENRLESGKFQGQSGNYARLMIRIELVAQTVMAYYRLQDYDTARFWGMRSIHLARVQFGDTVDMPLLDFDASGNWARVYLGTSLASRELGQMVEALDLYRIAKLKLPGDAQVMAEAGAFERAKTEFMTGIQRSASA